MKLRHVRDVFFDCFLHACERCILSSINKNAKVYQNLWTMVVVLFSYSLTFFSSVSIFLNQIILIFFWVIILSFSQQVRRLLAAASFSWVPSHLMTLKCNAQCCVGEATKFGWGCITFVIRLMKFHTASNSGFYNLPLQLLSWFDGTILAFATHILSYYSY